MSYPSHYDLVIVPDAEKLEFHGTLRISVDVRQQSPEIVLNADALTIDRATVGSGRRASDGDIRQQTATGSFTFEPMIQGEPFVW